MKTQPTNAQPVHTNGDALRLARDMAPADRALSAPSDPSTTVAPAARRGCHHAAVQSRRQSPQNKRGGAASKQIPRGGTTLAQQIKRIIANPNWTANQLQALLPKPQVRLLSQYDFRAFVQPTDLAWAAGFFDGEGCITIVRQRYKDPTRQPTYRLKIYVSQTNKRSLEEFEWIVGLRGRIVEQKARGKSRRSCYHLIYESLASAVVLRRLQPYLRRKREQCEIALDFQMQCDIHTHFGPKGCPQHVWELRRAYFDRMQTIKGDQ